MPDDHSRTTSIRTNLLSHTHFTKKIARVMLFHPLVWPITINPPINRRDSLLKFASQQSNGQFEALLTGAT